MAIDVPLSVIVKFSSHVDMIATPGAYASTQLPQLENERFVAAAFSAAELPPPS